MVEDEPCVLFRLTWSDHDGAVREARGIRFRWLLENKELQCNRFKSIEEEHEQDARTQRELFLVHGCCNATRGYVHMISKIRGVSGLTYRATIVSTFRMHAPLKLVSHRTS
jgi:hypothetical protein